MFIKNFGFINNMEKEYPNIVCIQCLNDAIKDTIKYEKRHIKWNSYYTAYVAKCDVCGNERTCTEPRDAGYPTFKYIYIRQRFEKINKLIKKIR